MTVQTSQTGRRRGTPITQLDEFVRRVNRVMTGRIPTHRKAF